MSSDVPFDGLPGEGEHLDTTALRRLLQEKRRVFDALVRSQDAGGHLFVLIFAPIQSPFQEAVHGLARGGLSYTGVG